MLTDNLRQFSEARELLRPVKSAFCTRRIFVAGCFSEVDTPSGGHKMLYRHVDILNKHGIPASVLHLKRNFRYSWFSNSTRVTYLERGSINTSDILVLPETLGSDIAEIARGMNKVIFNQNCYYTFSKYQDDTRDIHPPYEDSEVLAAIVVSDNSREYLQHVFPNLRIYRIRPSVDPHTFHPSWPKHKLICCMPRKRRRDLLQVLHILNFRRVLVNYGYDVLPIDNVSEQKVATLLSQCSIYLSTGEREGFGLPVAEAMSSGCIVVGFHGEGGKEFMIPNCTYPIESGNIIGFARAVEDVITLSCNNPEYLRLKGEEAAAFIRQQYSTDLEEADVVGAWNRILSGL